MNPCGRWMNTEALSTALHGRRVLVTRPRQQAQEFVRLLQQAGAEALALPLIRIAAPVDPQPLWQALAALADYDAVLLTSVNGVAAVRRLLQPEGAPAFVWPSTVRLFAVGPKTAAALQRLGWPVSQPQADFRAESLLALLQQQGVAGWRVLYPRAEQVRPVLPEGLRAAGAMLEDPVAYRTLPDLERRDELLALLPHLDAVTFASSSSVEQFVALLGSETAAAVCRDLCCASIGPVTTATAQHFGLAVQAEAEPYTLEGLVAALQRHFVSLPTQERC